VVVEDPIEVGFIEHQQVAASLGSNGCVARGQQQQCDFAEKIAILK
jgi:hypothetical protein